MELKQKNWMKGLFKILYLMSSEISFKIFINYFSYFKQIHFNMKIQNLWVSTNILNLEYAI